MVFSSLTRRPSSRVRPTLAKTYCRKAPPPRAGGHRHCSAATGWRAATHAHLSPTHTRALPETFWTFLRARNHSHKPCKSWIISVFAVGLLGVFSVTTHPASGRFSIARKAAMPSGCLRAIDLSTTNDTLVLYKGSWNTVILAASLDMTLPPIRPHSSKVVTGLPNPMMYNACTTQSSPATGWCNRPKVSSTTMCESLQACGPSTAVKACGPDYDLCICAKPSCLEPQMSAKSVPICRCPICPNLSLSHLCWTNLSLPNLMLPNLSLPNVSLPNLMLDQGDCVVVQICPNVSLSNCCPTRLEMTKLFYASESKTNQPLKRVSSVIHPRLLLRNLLLRN